jgi:hypothetical protein
LIQTLPRLSLALVISSQKRSLPPLQAIHML